MDISWPAKSGKAPRRLHQIVRINRTGSVMMAPTNSSAPPTAIPTNRKGNSSSQTMG